MGTNLFMQTCPRSIYFKIAPDVWGIRDLFVNLYLVRNPSDGKWVLIDTGYITAAKKVKHLVKQLLGPLGHPVAILLTHGHFDHVGSLKKLADEWNVPIYAHEMEAPYLTNSSDYPPLDPSVGGGLIARLSWLYPKSTINVKDRLHPLPDDYSVPFLSEWMFVYTPGHAPGHVSFFRKRDGVLIAGDAIITTKTESVWDVLWQTQVVSGPPKYSTYDWEMASQSAKHLAELHPTILATGHGKPMSGPKMQQDLHQLAQHFKELAIPKQGRYVNQPAITNRQGVIFIPPKKSSFFIAWVILFLILILLFWLF